ENRRQRGGRPRRVVGLRCRRGGLRAVPAAPAAGEGAGGGLRLGGAGPFSLGRGVAGDRRRPQGPRRRAVRACRRRGAGRQGSRSFRRRRRGPLAAPRGRAWDRTGQGAFPAEAGGRLRGRRVQKGTPGRQAHRRLFLPPAALPAPRRQEGDRGRRAPPERRLFRIVVRAYHGASSCRSRGRGGPGAARGEVRHAEPRPRSLPVPSRARRGCGAPGAEAYRGGWHPGHRLALGRGPRSWL
ncbi:MAG: hypothetical protein AVDCRST_MAG05-300, partial [uncultured Rubrobacteraceae bacterium]